MKRSSSDGAADRPLEECTALEYILMGDLRDLLEEPSDEHTGKWLLAVLDALLETLPQELHLRDEGGYLAEVLEQYPSWYKHVENLRSEKQALYRKLAALRDGIGRPDAFAVIADEVRRDLREWMASLTAHQRHERRIVQTAFTLEVGVGD